ncbi:MAG: hypothetical protein AAF985_10895, partial [Bacteroidota bacterium]
KVKNTWANSHCLMIPEKVAQYFVLVSDLTDNLYKNYLNSSFRRIADNYICYSSEKMNRFDVVISKENHISEIIKLQEFDFTKDHNISKYSLEREFPIAEQNRFATLTGIKGFFKSVLFTDEQNKKYMLDTGGGEVTKQLAVSDCWKHTYLPLPEQVSLNGQKSVLFSLEREPSSSLLSYSWRLRDHQALDLTGGFVSEIIK